MADPIALNEAARCWYCLEPGEIEYVKTYLLAQIAGGSTDPNALLEASRCFDCLTPGQIKQVQVYLLDAIANP